jgi:hypothetical protein
MDTLKKIDSLPVAPPSKPVPSRKVSKENALDPLQKKKKATKKKNGKL